jgi:hypothetical protein
MIQVNELRIGNKFMYTNDNIVGSVFSIRYDRVDGYLINGDIPESHMHPIPLTDKRLKSLGFKYRDHLEDWFIDIGNSYILIIGKNVTSVCRENQQPTIVGWVTAIHHLQNLWFALTNEELNIIL